MKSILVVLFIVVITSCSTTNVSVKDNLQPAGKKIGIATLRIVEQKKGANFKSDSVCTCIAESINNALVPYLHKAGFSVFNLDVEKNNRDSVMKQVSSLNLDYSLTGNGIIHTLGKSTFVDQLSVELQDIKTGEVMASASFSGTSIRPHTAAQKIGEGLVKKIK